MTRFRLALAAFAAALVLALVTVAATPAVADHDHGGATPPPPGQTSTLEPLAVDCSGSNLPPHTGFQSADAACVSTAFGEQSAQEDNPSLLIVGSPRRLRVNQGFTIRVSTQNLVRDRFLAAGQGGYYIESATLQDDGFTRGHFHTGCREIGNARRAPDPVRSAVFVATEDGGGGNRPDVVRVTLPGLPRAGTWQCASWAGDGSHRIPMMAFANQMPAFDAFRVEVRGRR